jgi:oligosaccharide reducing-end xylanase
MQHFSRRQFLCQVALSGLTPVVLAACNLPANPTPTADTPGNSTQRGAFSSGEYRNLFLERGKDLASIEAKIADAWQSLFDSQDDERRVYYPAGENQFGPMAYIKDIGNGDIRSEGMSYGMMIALQLNKQAAFDAIWNWANTHMRHKDGVWKGYFSWHNTDDGTKIDNNPASDGEEWMAMALLFAAHRWGSSPHKIDYLAEANSVLDTMLHRTDMVKDAPLVTNMFDANEHQVVFVPSGAEATFTDPSYHLPAYYELWSRWAMGYNGQRDQDRAFWQSCANTSRDFFQKTSHPSTGLAPDYANFDGTPRARGGHDAFRFDAYRTIANVAVDYAWFGVDKRERELCDRLQAFFANNPGYVNQYTLDGQPLSKDRSPGLIAMNAVASLAASNQEQAATFVDALWELSVPTGTWRYYDGLLYLMALLHVSGNFRIYAPAS